MKFYAVCGTVSIELAGDTETKAIEAFDRLSQKDLFILVAAHKHDLQKVLKLELEPKRFDDELIAAGAEPFKPLNFGSWYLWGVEKTPLKGPRWAPEGMTWTGDLLHGREGEPHYFIHDSAIACSSKAYVGVPLDVIKAFALAGLLSSVFQDIFVQAGLL
jgi:hypothetical protein